MKYSKLTKIGGCIYLAGILAVAIPKLLLSIHSLAPLICQGPGYTMPSDSLAAITCITGLFNIVGLILIILGLVLFFLGIKKSK